MTLRLGPRVLLMLLTYVLVATVLPASPSTARVSDPTKDTPTLPAHCTKPGERVTYRAVPCYLTSYRKKRPTLVLWGDSHAWQQIPAIRPLARRYDVNLVMFQLGGCAPFLVRGNTTETLYACERSNLKAMRFVRKLKREKKKVRVLLGAYWQGYRDLYRRIYVDRELDASEYKPSFLRSIRKFQRRTPRLFKELGGLRVRSDVIGQAPTVPENPPPCEEPVPYSCDLPRRRALPQEGRTTQWLKRVIRPLPRRSRIIRYHGPYCSADTCSGKDDGIYTFIDDLHMSATRTRTLGGYFRPTIRSLS